MNKKNEEKVLPMEVIALDWGGIEEPYNFILVLKEKNGNRIINMLIGWLDAQYISFLLEKIDYEVPIIHDVMNKIISDFNITINSVIINALSDNTFFAEIVLNNGKAYPVKPTDAIIIGLKNNLDILIDEKIIDKIGIAENEFFDKFTDNIGVEDKKILKPKKSSKTKIDESYLSSLIELKDYEAAELAKSQLIHQFENDLSICVKEENYEKASKLRDKVNDLKKMKILNNKNN